MKAKLIWTQRQSKYSRFITKMAKILQESFIGFAVAKKKSRVSHNI